MVGRGQRKIVLLGPQQGYGHLKDVLCRIDTGGRVALVTAGWEEDESSDAQLRQQMVEYAVDNLNLYERAEEVFVDDPDFLQALKHRQDRLRELRDVYRLRLDLLLTAAKELIKLYSRSKSLQPELESAIRSVKELDDQYLQRTTEVVDFFESELQSSQRDAIARHREDIRQILANCGVLLIAGGNVGVLLNRLRIFAPIELAPEIPIVAWSGGAMTLTSRIVLFHDSPPQGPGNAEILRGGLDLVPRTVWLPHARQRLKLDDPIRVSLFAKRFSPDRCVVCDAHTHLQIEGRRLRAESNVTSLSIDGGLQESKN